MMARVGLFPKIVFHFRAITDCEDLGGTGGFQAMPDGSMKKRSTSGFSWDVSVPSEKLMPMFCFVPSAAFTSPAANFLAGLLSRPSSRLALDSTKTNRCNEILFFFQ